jgi:hypothetical protein
MHGLEKTDDHFIPLQRNLHEARVGHAFGQNVKMGVSFPFEYGYNAAPS